MVMARNKVAKTMSQGSQTVTTRDKPHDTPNDSDAFAEPTQEAIRERAYAIYEARGGAEGSEIDDWAQAERELTARNKRPSKGRKTK